MSYTIMDRWTPVAKKKKNSVMGMNKIVIQRESLQSDYKDFKEVRSLMLPGKEDKKVFKSGV